MAERSMAAAPLLCRWTACAPQDQPSAAVREHPMETWSIRIHKDYLKFSAAHFLIFPDGSAERLHGHNYKVFTEVECALDPHGLVLNFKEIKPLVKQICDELDEHLLIPGKHPVLRCTPRDGMTEVVYRERR